MAKPTRTLPLFEPLRPAPIQRLRGWLQASHPFPLAMVVAVTGLVGAATGAEVASSRFLLMLGAMFFSQLAIGWTNDYVDRQSDAMYQPVKPIPSGMLDASSLPTLIVSAIFVAFTLGAVLGMAPLALLGIGTGAGLAYDLALKDTRYSPIAFVVAFAVLPLFVWTSLDAFREELLALYLVGSPLAVAVHLANVLPDIEADAAAGRRNLGVILGRQRSLQVIGASMAAPPLLVLVTLPWLEYSRGLLAGVLIAYGLLTAFAAFSYTKPGREALVWGFRFVVLAAVLFASGWLAAV
jgi:4-hydroxybenzoate polyprenyltransferase